MTSSNCPEIMPYLRADSVLYMLPRDNYLTVWAESKLLKNTESGIGMGIPMVISERHINTLGLVVMILKSWARAIKRPRAKAWPFITHIVAIGRTINLARRIWNRETASGAVYLKVAKSNPVPNFFPLLKVTKHLVVRQRAAFKNILLAKRRYVHVFRG